MTRELWVSHATKFFIDGVFFARRPARRINNASFSAAEPLHRFVVGFDLPPLLTATSVDFAPRSAVVCRSAKSQ